METVLSLRVIRHEENPSACPITCNGKFATPWSKTMVGTQSEDKAYAFEVTYNYGVDAYERGEGLRRFEMRTPSVAASVAAARKLDLAVQTPAPGRAVITGPDGYVYAVEEVSSSSTPFFAKVVLGTPDVASTAEWYVDVLGMRVEGAELAFAGDDVHFLLEQVEGFQTARQWDGRNAFSLPSTHVRAIYDRLVREQPQRIVHDLQEINEETGLGVLLIAIISDPNGLELCLVSSEAFEPAIAGAADFRPVDFARHEELAAEYAAAAAAAAEEPALPFVG